MKRNFKLLYLLTLGALCLYVTTGPAEAVVINNAGPISDASAVLNSSEGNLTLPYGPVFSPDSGPSVDLGLDASCGTPGGACGLVVDFAFYVWAPGSITVELHGTSNDPNAEGAVLFPLSDADPPWDVNGDFQLSMEPFTVPVGVGWYYGQFTITSLAEGGFVNLGPESLDFVYESAAVPEPGSALLLGAGIAFVAFLRRKIRR